MGARTIRPAIACQAAAGEEFLHQGGKQAQYTRGDGGRRLRKSSLSVES